MTDDLERVEQYAQQLRILWPRLADALLKDQYKGDGRAGKSVVPSIPVNGDVLDSIRQLAAEIPIVDMQMRTALKFGTGIATRRDIGVILSNADNTWRRLDAHPTLRANADEWVIRLGRWLRTARLALGLTTQPKPVGEHCPFCEGELHLLGDEATLHEPDDIEAITWERGDQLFCTSCELEWPAPHWDILGKLIETERERETKNTDTPNDKEPIMRPTPPGQWQQWNGQLGPNSKPALTPGMRYDVWTADGNQQWIRENPNQGTITLTQTA